MAKSEWSYKTAVETSAALAAKKVSAVELAQSANAVILKAGRAETSPALNVEYRKMTAECYRQAEQLVKALSAGIAELR